MSRGLKDLVIIITDSRGKGIEDYIKENDLEDDFAIVTKVIRGCDVSRAAHLARSLISSYQHRNYYCMIFLGICSLTDISRTKRSRSIRYPDQTRVSKVQCIIEDLKGLKVDFGDRINYPTIIPASLAKFYAYSNPGKSIPADLPKEQNALLEDLNTINSWIKDTNLQSSITSTVNLSARFFSKSIKKNRKTKSGSKRRVEKLNDNHLYDGLHLDSSIRSTCFGLLFEGARRDLFRLNISQHQPTQETSSDESTPEDWDFKRGAVIDALHGNA